MTKCGYVNFGGRSFPPGGRLGIDLGDTLRPGFGMNERGFGSAELRPIVTLEQFFTEYEFNLDAAGFAATHFGSRVNLTPPKPRSPADACHGPRIIVEVPRIKEPEGPDGQYLPTRWFPEDRVWVAGAITWGMNPQALPLRNGNFLLVAKGDDGRRSIVVSALMDVTSRADISDRILQLISSVRFDPSSRARSEP